MNKKTGKNTAARKMAFCGVFAALSLVLLYVGGLTVLDLTLLMLCSFITVVVIIETGDKYGYIYAAVTSALALILLPSKLYAVEYIVFSTVYPIIKPHIERIPNRVVAWVLKIAALDAMFLGCVLLGQFILNVGDEFFPLSLLTMLFGTAFFILYDFAFSKCIKLYLVKLRKIFGFSKYL